MRERASRTRDGLSRSATRGPAASETTSELVRGDDRRLAATWTAASRSEGAGATTTRGAIALQRTVGNAATASMLSGRPDVGPVVQRAGTGDLDTALNFAEVHSNTISSSAGGIGPSIGLVTGGVGIGTGAYENYKRRGALSESKKTGNKARIRANERGLSTSGGTVTSGVLGTVSSGTSGASSGLAIANSVGAVGSTAAHTVGVVGSAVALPVNIFNLVRGARRAELQRRRLVAIEGRSQAIALRGKDDQANQSTGQIKTSKQDSKDDHTNALTDKADAEKERDRLKGAETGERTALTGLQETLQKSKSQLATLQKGEAKPGEIESVTIEISQLEKTIAKQQERVTVASAATEKAEESIKQFQQIVDEKQKDAEEFDKQGEIEEGAKSSGYFDQAGKDMPVPTLREIADYATKKNKRGFIRRTIGAVGAGLGVAAGGLGIAAAVEKLTGGSAASGLGIASAVIAGVAAVAAVGVLAWKIGKWAKKRSKQSKAVEAKNKSLAPGQKKIDAVDVTAKRRHYATSLVMYATKGSDAQRQEASAIMASLDPKGPWAAKESNGMYKPYDGHSGSRSGKKGADAIQEREEVIKHFMDKMGSGG